MNFTDSSKFSEEIIRLQNSNKLIIVEGKKDLITLRKLEIKNIITINKPIFQIVESIKEKEVIILTDIDKTGKRLYSKLRHDLQRRGIKIDNRFRNFLIQETNLTNIEGLIKYRNKI